jgi:hypothetical protein
MKQPKDNCFKSKVRELFNFCNVATSQNKTGMTGTQKYCFRKPWVLVCMYSVALGAPRIEHILVSFCDY